MAKRKKALTKKRHRTFLEALAKYGNVTLSAKLAGVGRTWVYGKRQQHRDFAEAWDAAEMTFVDMLASIEAKRATIGETVERRTTRVETDRKGNVVATIETTETRTRLSDSCLIHLLDRRHPEYRAAAQGRELARPGGKPMTVVTIPADASDIEAADAYLKLLRQR